MANRTRKIVLRVPVMPEERELIEQKMSLLHTKNFSAYARKMLIDCYIVNMDTSDIRAQTAEIQKIGVNVNQIAKRLNSMGPVYAQDIEDIKGALAQIRGKHDIEREAVNVSVFTGVSGCKSAINPPYCCRNLKYDTWKCYDGRKDWRTDF